MTDPIFDKAELLRPYKRTFFRPSGKPPIPRQIKARQKRTWENWLYGVLQDVNLQGTGTIKVYRDESLIGTTPVVGWPEAGRLYEDTIEAAKEATEEVVRELS